MSEMVERVARAINPWAFDYEAGECQRQDLLRLARAAIEAMREPTEAMYDAAFTQTGLVELEFAMSLWQAMISAALSPEEEGIGRG